MVVTDEQNLRTLLKSVVPRQMNCSTRVDSFCTKKPLASFTEANTNPPGTRLSFLFLLFFSVLFVENWKEAAAAGFIRIARPDGLRVGWWMSDGFCHVSRLRHGTASVILCWPAHWTIGISTSPESSRARRRSKIYGWIQAVVTCVRNKLLLTTACDSIFPIGWRLAT